MKKLINFLEKTNALLWVLAYKLIPKNPVTNKILIFADLGIGDMIMFLPTIRAIYESKYEITFKCERAEIIEILKGIFPGAKFIFPYIKGNQNNKFIGLHKALYYYRFGYVLCNMHQAYRHNIKYIIALRIPVSIGHAWKENKFSKLWTNPVEYDNRNYQPNENIKLLKPLGIHNYSEELFFKTESFNIPYSNYILIQAYSHTNTGKNIMNIHEIISKNEGKNIVFIGSVEEKDYNCLDYNKTHLKNLCGKLNIFETAFLIKKAKEFHCNEGGLAHIASAIGANAIVYVNPKIKTWNIWHSNLKYIK